MPRSRRARYESLARQTATKHGIPVRLFLSLIDHESSWDPNAVSPVGASGLTQLMPGTARTLGVDPFNPRQNLEGGARYLSNAYKHFGDWKTALRAYNVGWTGAENPSAGLEYANSVLAGRNAAKFLSAPKAPPLAVPGLPKQPMGVFNKVPSKMSMGEITKLLFPHDLWFQQEMAQIATPGKFATGAPGPTSGTPDMTPQGNAKYPSTYEGKTYVPATAWKGTHVTDNLDWNSGKQTAVDIMLNAGTPIGAPENGRIVRHGSAQGGSSLYFLSDSGHLYWMGHIDGAVAVGTHVRRGQPIAVVSSRESPNHLHIDRYYGRNPGQYY